MKPSTYISRFAVATERTSTCRDPMLSSHSRKNSSSSSNIEMMSATLQPRSCRSMISVHALSPLWMLSCGKGSWLTGQSISPSSLRLVDRGGRAPEFWRLLLARAMVVSTLWLEAAVRRRAPIKATSASLPRHKKDAKKYSALDVCRHAERHFSELMAHRMVGRPPWMVQTSIAHIICFAKRYRSGSEY